MKKQPVTTSPDAWIAALDGWRLGCVVALRGWVLASAPLTEAIKWGNRICESNGPVLMIRAEVPRVLFAFRRGQRLRDIEPRLKPGGKHEMATLSLGEGDAISAEIVRRPVCEAVH